MKNIFSDKTSKQVLDTSTKFWFLTVAIGQWIFALYIIGFYAFSGLEGNFEGWNKALPHGYEEGNFTGNTFLGIHVLLAGFISFAGPLQLIPQLRRRFPVVHRWTGRLYLLVAFLMSVSGLYLGYSGRTLVGDAPQHLTLSVNGVLIIGFGVMALRHALLRNIAAHRRWALRLFLAVSGVWFFRIGLMAWLLVHGKPVGFDLETFSGPFLSFLAFTAFIFPVVILEGYFWARDRAGPKGRVISSSVLVVLAIIVGTGVFGATMGMWLPRL